MWFATTVSVAAVLLCQISADLPAKNNECGRTTCKKYEYCSEYETQCKSCEIICNKNGHNFDGTKCKESCQDYLHDSIYVRKDELSLSGNIADIVQKNSRLILANQVLIAIIIIALLSFVAWKIYIWKKNNKITLSDIKNKLSLKKSDNNANKPDVNGRDFNSATVGKPDLRLDMPTPGTDITENVHSPGTVSTSISRRPTEDNTLDYAYDNPAMSTPSPNSRPHESSF